MLSLDEAYKSVINEHRGWLSSFNRLRLQKWENLYSSQPESAICEAIARKELASQVDNIEPYEDMSTGGPDYICFKDGKHFYMEVTCLTIEAVTKKSGLEQVPVPGKTTSFGLLTDMVFGVLCDKTPQCSGLDAACIVAVATLHFSAGQLCFHKHLAEDVLTGTPHIAIPINTQRGEPAGEGYQATNLQSAAFIRPTRNPSGFIENARNPISAVLLCSFGCVERDIIGLIHPNPNHVFDRSLLADIEFCRLKDGYKQGQIDVEWI